ARRSPAARARPRRSHRSRGPRPGTSTAALPRQAVRRGEGDLRPLPLARGAGRLDARVLARREPRQAPGAGLRAPAKLLAGAPSRARLLLDAPRRAGPD